jgi:hypothetical protein
MCYIGIEICLKLPAHISHRSSNRFLINMIRFSIMISSKKVLIYSIGIRKICTTYCQRLHGKWIQRIRIAWYGYIVIYASCNQLWAEYPSERMTEYNDCTIWSTENIYQALWFFKYWNNVPENGSITNILPRRSFIFNIVSSAIIFGLKWLDSSSLSTSKINHSSCFVLPSILTWYTPFNFSNCHDACNAWGCKTKIDIFFVEVILNCSIEKRQIWLKGSVSLSFYWSNWIILMNDKDIEV